MFGCRKIFSRNAIFRKGKYFQVFDCIMKIVVKNIFMCLVLFWKCYFPTNFSHFLGYVLSIQTNFITKNFKITAKSQHHTPPKLQFNPQQQTPAIKSHNHQNTTTTPPQQQQKSKSQREIGGSKIGGSKVRSSGAVQLVQCCCRRGARCDRRDLVRAIVGLELELVIWASSHALSLSASNPEMVWSENLSFKPFPWSKAHFTRSTSNNFWKIYFPCATKHPYLWKSISESGLKSKQTQPKWFA